MKHLFVEFALFSESGTEKGIFLNVAHIVAIYPAYVGVRERSDVLTSTGVVYRLTDAPTVVMYAIEILNEG